MNAQLIQLQTNLAFKNLTYNETIYSIIRHVSKSGMTRHISFFHIYNNQPHYLTNSIAEVLGYKMNKYHDAIIVGGCGMDMAFHVVNSLEYKLNELTPGQLQYNLISRIL